MGASDVKYFDVFDAAAMHDLDQAVAHLQDKAGIKTGDVAGIFFSGKRPWTECEPGERCVLLMNYLKTEANYEDEP